MDFLKTYFTYDQLRCIWWLLIGVLMLGWAITDGFDVGVAMLLKIVGKDDAERRVMINSVAPHWDGNQVWLITAGGAIFAAWPIVYATAFSGLYLAMILVLMALFFRPLAFEYRSKIESVTWRSAMDWCLSIGSLVPALVIGVAFGNLLQGVAFDFNSNHNYNSLALGKNIAMPFYHGGIFGNEAGGPFSGFLGLISLLNPYALLAGLISVLMLAAHGGSFLQLKTADEVRRRSEKVTAYCSIAAAFLFIVAGVLLLYYVKGYQIVSWHNGANSPSMPSLSKEVVMGRGLWFSNYHAAPILYIFPLLGIAGFLSAAMASRAHWHVLSFLSTSIAMFGVVFTAGVTMFPFIMPSYITPNHSLTMWDATSSYNTLAVMTLVAMVMTPIVLAYTICCYYVMRGRLTKDYVQEHSNKLY